MPPGLTEITEIATALGMLSPSLEEALIRRPWQLSNVDDRVWERLVDLHRRGAHGASFIAAFQNGQMFLNAVGGLRGRPPLRVEWKGPHRPPGDEVIPADLRVDHVYLVSCKYVSKVLSNPGPRRLFERLLVGEERSTINWFHETAPAEFQALYVAASAHAGLAGLPSTAPELSRRQQLALKEALTSRVWPLPLRAPWSDLCATVAAESARRWRSAMPTQRQRLRLLWRLLRITTATYFVLGSDREAQLRLRVDSAWDWMQAFTLRSFEAAPRAAGQPEVTWRAIVRRRSDGVELAIDGHVEIRWSHGRFVGSPESKVYLDTPHVLVPGYNSLA